MSPSKSANRTLIAITAALIAVAGLMTGTAPSEAAAARGIPVPLTASIAPSLPSGAVRLGSLAPGRKLTIEVALNVAHQAALNAFLNGLNDPRSPFYQQFLRPGQFGPRFGPSLAQVAAVSDALRSAGLSPGPVSANRLSIPVTASVAAIEHAFGISLNQYRMPGGRLAYANSAAPELAAAVAPLVQGVLGLDDLYQWQHQSTGPLTAAAPAGPIVSTKDAKRQRGATPAAPALGPQPCAAASNSLANTANTIASHYGLSLLYLVKDLGAGARIAVAELEPNLKSDIAAYEKCYGIKTKVNYLKVDSGVGSGAGQGEAALDIEILAALAPKSVIDVYQAPNTGDGKGEGFYDLFKKFAVADTDKVMSVSWGACEARLSAAAIRAQGALFAQANAQGQTIFVASGDEGSTTCFDPAASKADDRVSADAPATSPFVIAVGGTSFTGSGTAQKEIVWNDSNSAFGVGAGGGGVSTIWCMPNYQHLTKIPGLINSESKRDASKSCASKTFREIPERRRGRRSAVRVRHVLQRQLGVRRRRRNQRSHAGLGLNRRADERLAVLQGLRDQGTAAPAEPLFGGRHLSLLHLREDIAGRAGCHDRQQRLHAIGVYGRACTSRARASTWPAASAYRWSAARPTTSGSSTWPGSPRSCAITRPPSCGRSRSPGYRRSQGRAARPRRSRCTGPGSCRSASPTRRRSGPGPRCSRPNTSPAPPACARSSCRPSRPGPSTSGSSPCHCGRARSPRPTTTSTSNG